MREVVDFRKSGHIYVWLGNPPVFPLTEATAPLLEQGKSVILPCTHKARDPPEHKVIIRVRDECLILKSDDVP